MYDFLFSCANQTADPIPCNAGSYAPPGSVKCYECPLGASCPSSKMPTFILCVNGSYSDVTNATSCKSCPPGKKCPHPSQAPVDCPDGTFSRGGTLLCTDCPAGFR